jgi:hypothetical protein
MPLQHWLLFERSIRGKSGCAKRAVREAGRDPERQKACTCREASVPEFTSLKRNRTEDLPGGRRPARVFA